MKHVAATSRRAGTGRRLDGHRESLGAVADRARLLEVGIEDDRSWRTNPAFALHSGLDCLPRLIGLERYAWKSDRVKVSIPVFGMVGTRWIASTNC